MRTTNVILGLVPRNQRSAGSGAIRWMDGRAPRPSPRAGKPDHDSLKAISAWPLSPWGRGREAMTCVRVPLAAGRRNLNGADVSHSAELVRGDFGARVKAPSSAPSGHLLPK